MNKQLKKDEHGFMCTYVTMFFGILYHLFTVLVYMTFYLAGLIFLSYVTAQIGGMCEMQLDIGYLNCDVSKFSYDAGLLPSNFFAGILFEMNGVVIGFACFTILVSMLGLILDIIEL